MTVSPWTGLKDATPYERGVFLPAGGSFHLSWIKGNQPLRNPKNGDMLLFFDFEVLASSMPQEHPVGSERAYCIKMNDPNVALRSLKSLLQNVMGLDHDAQRAATFNGLLEAGLMDHILGASNPLAGFDLGVETVAITTKRGQPFTRHDWKTVVGDASRVDQVLGSFRSAPAVAHTQGYGAPPAAQWAPPAVQPYAPAALPGIAPPPPAPMAPPPPPPAAPLPPGIPPGSPMHTDPASGRVAYLVAGQWKYI